MFGSVGEKHTDFTKCRASKDVSQRRYKSGNADRWDISYDTDAQLYKFSKVLYKEKKLYT